MGVLIIIFFVPFRFMLTLDETIDHRGLLSETGAIWLHATLKGAKTCKLKSIIFMSSPKSILR